MNQNRQWRSAPFPPQSSQSYLNPKHRWLSFTTMALSGQALSICNNIIYQMEYCHRSPSPRLCCPISITNSDANPLVQLPTPFEAANFQVTLWRTKSTVGQFQGKAHAVLCCTSFCAEPKPTIAVRWSATTTFARVQRVKMALKEGWLHQAQMASVFARLCHRCQPVPLLCTLSSTQDSLRNEKQRHSCTELLPIIKFACTFKVLANSLYILKKHSF